MLRQPSPSLPRTEDENPRLSLPGNLNAVFIHEEDARNAGKMKVIEKAIDSLRTNPNMYRAWDKSRKYGCFHWVAFLLFSIVPIGKLLCGKGNDWVEKIKRNNCTLRLDGFGVEQYDVLFFLPNFEEDFIQKTMVLTRNFFERAELANLKKNYIRKGAVCLDIGANIGNHSIYYAKICNASRVYAFEPVGSTFDILKKNIALNHADGIIKAFNCGVSDRKKSASIIHFARNNIGATQLAEDENGTIRLVSLDDMGFQHVDFMKIDIENMEYDLLCGASSFFAENKPIIFIEVQEDGNFEKVDALLKSYGYRLLEKRDAKNYIYGCGHTRESR